MPQLGTDARQNLLLVWTKAHASGASLVYSRYASGTWSAAKAVAGGTVKDTSFAVSGAVPLGSSASGLAALMWLDQNAQNVPSVVRLASFY
jgi:hypothetical protein